MFIKGVNRRIVEVNAHGSFFEKAVLYVRPECAALTDEQLSYEAGDYVDMLSSAYRTKKRRIVPAAALSAAAAAGAAVSAAVMLISGVVR